jgi:hypothetical protein
VFFLQPVNPDNKKEALDFDSMRRGSRALRW